MLQKISPSLKLLFLSLLVISCGTTNRGFKKGTSAPPAELKPGNIIEKGKASWYGPNFHGKLTANGEKYDMYGLTAAHRTLPFDTIVKVKNLDNGKSVQVRVNDRGPFAKNRIIDLSRKAAQHIDMLGPGTANVALVLMETDLKNSRTTNLKVPTYTIQLGSFQHKAKAFDLSRKVQSSRVEVITMDNSTFYRVYYGLYIDSDKAQKKQKELNQRGFNGYVKQIEN